MAMRSRFLSILFTVLLALYGIQRTPIPWETLVGDLTFDEPISPINPNGIAIDPIIQQEYTRIDSFSDEKRCSRYGFNYKKEQKKRRVFFGSMVADDSYDLIRMHAVETYSLYDFVNLVESNSTHCGQHNRTLRFAEGTQGHDLIHSGIFGPDTEVKLDLYLGDAFGAIDMNRETIQREEILRGWKRAGMREDDLGLMSDMDEMFTRDFLHALKVCDIPLFQPGQNCQRPSILAHSIVFESSPECVTKDSWFHPNIMLGECIEGIGDPTGRPLPKRKFLEVHGERQDGWGKNGFNDYPKDVLSSRIFPLSNGADFRVGASNHGLISSWKGEKVPEGSLYRTGYHFHNFFETDAQLRHKYTTYAHPFGGARYMPLTDVHKDDLDMMVRCARDIPNSANPTSKQRIEGGFEAYLGVKPIHFLNATYRKARHTLLKRIVEEDEKMFGSKYPPNTTTIAPLLKAPAAVEFTPPSLASRVKEFVVEPLFQQEYDRIDLLDDEKRCSRYRFKYNKSQKKRRIFFGSMVADDSYELIRMHAAETYGLYDFMNLVESNSTHCGKYSRTLRFVEGTQGHDLIHSGIFGPDTEVKLDLYLGDAFGAIDMNRETIQREEVLRGWKRAGMREDDLGLMSDMDEMFTRDFLHALKTCDIREFRSGQDCKAPSVLPVANVYESSPECLAKDSWHHPNIMIGECIEGIGDPTGRPVPKRQFLEVHGERVSGWGRDGPHDYPESVSRSSKYPLSNGADFRNSASTEGYRAAWVGEKPPEARNISLPEGTFFATGYHFHNFFATHEELRHKYTTYAHPYGGARHMKLSEVHKDDLDMMVRCARDLPNSANPEHKQRVEVGYDYVGSKPIYFLNETNRKARHTLLKRMVEEDEKEFGSKYPPNATRMSPL